MQPSDVSGAQRANCEETMSNIDRIEEEPTASNMGSSQGGQGQLDEVEQADIECPLCSGSGAVPQFVEEDEWHPENTQGPPVGWDFPRTSRSARRWQHRRRPTSLCWRPCRALFVSTVYVALALTLGFLGFAFYPRNPDFDLIDVHFTKLQLRWERDPSVLRSQTASEVGSGPDTADKVRTHSSGGAARHERIEVRTAPSESVEGSPAVAFKQVAQNASAPTQELVNWEPLGENSVDTWEELLERLEIESGATIFGRRLVLDIDLMVKVLVKNPNKVGVHYEASSLDIIYKDKKLGQAALPPGQQAAASSTVLVVPAQLNGLSTIGMSLNLLRDWEKKSVEMDIAARFTGTVDMIKIIPHEFIADMYCDVLTNPRTLLIMKRTCEWKYSGRI